MIRRYNQFVKENKTNEEFEQEIQTPVKTLPTLGGTKTAPVIKPGTTEKPSPTKPSPFRRDKPSVEPGTKAEFEGEEEEVGVDKYTAALQSLADAAGVEFDPSKKYLVIDGKEVTFPAEDEKYHIKGVRKGFSSVEDVLANLGGKSPQRQEVRDEMSSIKDAEVLEEPSFKNESKSYKNRFKK